MPSVLLPNASGCAERAQLNQPADLPAWAPNPISREVYAAAHVVAAPWTTARGTGATIDWDATLAGRHRLWELGLGVAEAMDTSQRGMGLNWSAARELAHRTLAARGPQDQVVVGIATDQLSPTETDLGKIRDAYLEQLADIEGAGGSVVMMASRQLAATATTSEDYIRVYREVLAHATRPVVLHWLGAAFDPALKGYWGPEDPYDAIDVVVQVMTENPQARGIKVSLLDAQLEEMLRARIPEKLTFTGDDYNYTGLIAGDGTHFSHALLGAFTVVAPYAAAALARLDNGDIDGFRNTLAPTEPLSRLVFEAPTQFYKVGVAWLAYLTDGQSHFRMLDGFETGRSLLHLADLVRHANGLGLFPDPTLTAERVNNFFAVQGLR